MKSVSSASIGVGQIVSLRSINPLTRVHLACVWADTQKVRTHRSLCDKLPSFSLNLKLQLLNGKEKMVVTAGPADTRFNASIFAM